MSTVYQKIGYMRVSTDDQDMQLQRDAMAAAGIPDENLYSDKMTGANMKRNGLAKALRRCLPGAHLYVWKLDRLGRSTIGILELIVELHERGIRLISLTENLDTDSAHGRFTMTILAAFAQMERDLISERTKAGVAAAKARGVRFGQKHSILDNPKRLSALEALDRSGDLWSMTGQAIIDAMNDADPKAKPIKGPQVWFNWKRKGLKGYVPLSERNGENG